MTLTYEQLKNTMDQGGVQAGVELVVSSLLKVNKIVLTDKGKREFSAWLVEYCEDRYGFTANMLVLFGLQKQDWLMELIREAMLSPKFMERLGVDPNKV